MQPGVGVGEVPLGKMFGDEGERGIFSLKDEITLSTTCFPNFSGIITCLDCLRN